MAYGPSFTRAAGMMLRNEGAYTNDPQAPNGESKFGISKRHHPNVDIPRLTLPEAIALHFHDIWTPLGLDALSFPIAAKVFDLAVQFGNQRAIWILQEALAYLGKSVIIDGHLGLESQRLVAAVQPDELMAALCGRCFRRCEDVINRQPVELMKFAASWAIRAMQQPDPT